MKEFTLSIALATYNGERYLDEQLSSFVSQTRLPDQLVVCDDCSTDATINMINEFARNVSFPVSIHRNNSNMGTGYSFARALEFCIGDIIIFSDQDDVWFSDKLEKIENVFLTQHGIDYTISDALIVNDKSHSLNHTLWQQRKFNKYWQRKFENGFELDVFLRLTITTGMTTAIRNDLRNYGSPNPPNINHDGWYIPLAVIYNRHGALIKEPLVRYRQHNTQQHGASKKSFIYRVIHAFRNNYSSIIRDIQSLESLTIYVERNTLPIHNESLNKVKDKIGHLYCRKRINEKILFVSLITLVIEVFRKRYFRYGSWKNILIDLLA